LPLVEKVRDCVYETRHADCARAFMNASPVLVLAVSGSLRGQSTNTELLRACAMLAPADMRLELYEGIGWLPHFNPDLDTTAPPAPVAAWRSRIAAADVLLISSPEYARGVPGVLKNALDWLVGGTEIIGKPVALLNGSPRASHAQQSLATTLATISAKLIAEQPYHAPVLGRNVQANGIIGDCALRAALTILLADLALAARV
jgi:chromate reductase, NAD(P)H dehydrogenase (quinone)